MLVCNLVTQFVMYYNNNIYFCYYFMFVYKAQTSNFNYKTNVIIYKLICVNREII